MTKEKQKLIRIAIVVLCVLLILLVVAPFVAAIAIYSSVFEVHFESYQPLAFQMEDFPLLCRQQYQFASNKKQTITGYRYYSAKENPTALVVFGHGFSGGGHIAYLDCINYFVTHGFWVFAFDATGNDESQGNVGGLPQQVIDMDYALKFVKSNDDFKNLPICLFGHSWGGYTVCATLKDHSEIKAVCEVAGFNISADMLKLKSEAYAGSAAAVAMPHVNFWEFLKFGKYAGYTAVDGLAKSNAKVVVIHSKQDTVVPFEYGAQILQNKFHDDKRFTFIFSEHKGHTTVYYTDEGIAYQNTFNNNLKQYENSLNGTMTEEQKAQWIKENLDRTQWANRLDTQLFDQIADIFRSAL